VHLALYEYTDGKAKVIGAVLSSAIALEQTADGVNAKRNQIQSPNRGASGERGFIAPIELHLLQRITQRRSCGGQVATIGSRGPHVNGLLDCFRVQKRHWSATVFAHAVVLKIDGRAALRAANLTHLGA